MTGKRNGICEIITIGDELLIGQVINTNASWMGEQLSLSGLQLKRVTSIGDNNQQILDALHDAVTRAEFVFITGGLGPTADDITKPALCEFFGTQLVYNEEAFQQVKALFQRRGMEVSDRNKAQAMLPENCHPVQNENGTAPGMWFEKDSAVIVSMPGVPFEMKAMFENQVIPKVMAMVNKGHILHKTIMTNGIGESSLADIIKDWEQALPINFKLAYLPQPGMVRLRLSGSGIDRNELEQTMNTLVTKLIPLISDYVFGYDNDTLEEIVGDLLKKSNKTIGTAESCTGGYLAHLITSISGSSAYFRGSVIAYANEIKTSALRVNESDIAKYGAVSKEVVEAMAIGLQKKFNVNYALATSGVAGPDGGTPEKPVGTIWIALATDKGVQSEKFQFGEHRGRNIRRSALSALNMLRIELLKVM
jgi:nicotinamide-nucleotide amidase